MLKFRNIEKRALLPRLASAVLVAVLTGQAAAQLTDIAAEPVINRQTISAKPNLMFILDDSGSMSRAYMPDELMNFSGSYGYLSAQCNGVAFDPSLDYLPPIYSNGTSYPNASFSSAKDDGYSSGSSTTNLANKTYYRYTGAEKKMGWTYDSSGNEITGSTFYRECTSSIGSTPGSAKFVAVTITSASPDAQKYANWWSYYRTRSLMMRTSVGLAVKDLDDGYRVGFSRINHAGVTDSIDFRDTKAFGATQRANFYSSLYSAPPAGGTPLRGALSKVGRYFAKKATGQTYDPIEYACQRNYALLSTDGYWNSGGSPGVTESSSYGPHGLDGNAVGNQDVSEVRPMYDGGNSVKTDKTPTTTTTRRTVVTNNKTTTSSSRDLIEIDGAGCKADRYNEWVTRETRTVVTSTDTPSIVRDTSTTTRTVVTTSGTVTSDTVSAPTTSSSTESTGSATAGAGSDSGWKQGTRAKTESCKNSDKLRSPGYVPYPDTTTKSSSQSTSPLTSETVVGQTTTTYSSSGGTSDTLADVAQYFYATDLRTPALGNCTSSTSGQSRDVCPNVVPTAGRDAMTSQHLTTFTLGLGTGGTLGFDKDYLLQNASCDPTKAPFTCDYAHLSGLKTPVKNWPATTTTLSGNSGDARNIDDLWHAAVNGRGQYYSAGDATALSQAITGVINSIKEVEGAGAAASFNSLTFVPGLSNQVFQAGYTAFAWTGDVAAYTVQGETGALSVSPQWSAKANLDARDWTTRKIYYRKAGSSTLRAFNYSNLNADGLGGNFAGFCSKSPVPAQCAGWTGTPAFKTAADDGDKLVRYLSGDRTNNLTNSASPLFRTRASILGDIIYGAPVFVGKPPFNYTDAGYSTFATAKSGREAVVYAGGNDGMLHAFSAATGVELWSYIPTIVMSKMYRLADTAYGNSHQSFVDAEPVIADVFTGGKWRTILVGGLGLGGKGYYALDVTDPLIPESLWEFTDVNLGLTFGNPVITKRADGTWVVVFASGYNNVGGAADGKGRLYVLDAGTGLRAVSDIVTGAGNTTTPSGLAKINAWVDVSTNNTAKRFYGGDMLGNLWRFDIDDLVQPYKGALLLGQLQTPGGAPQPVTTKPEVMLVSKVHPIVVVGTGRYLGDSDITDSRQNSIYIVKDPLINAGHGVLRTSPALVKHTLTVSGTSVTSTTEPIDWNTKSGWWFDLPNSGERVASNMSLSSGTLFVPSAVPSGDACISGGSSWLYRIDITSGLGNDPIGTLFSLDSLIVGQTFARLSNGDGKMYVRNSKGETKEYDTDKGKPVGAGDPRRTSWRELVN